MFFFAILVPTMTVTSDAFRLRRLVEDNAALRLLRADNAPVALALLTQHLGDDERRLVADDLHERIDEDLESLRAGGFDLPGSAQHYVTQWRNAGFLVRRASEGTREETLELSSHALQTIRFVQNLETPVVTATESRMTSLSNQIRQLAIDTDPQSKRRLERLQEQRHKLDKQIGAIRAGEDEPLGVERAVERLQDVISQARAVPDDFTRVRERFESLNTDLREQVLESESTQSKVLDDIFRGVDYIAESDAGRTFRAFTNLILDPSISGAFEGDVNAVLNRNFSRTLTVQERSMLRGFISTLKDLTSEIQEVTTTFARGLRRYVQSQDYRRDRVMRRQLQRALQTAVAVSETLKPYQDVGIDLALTKVNMSNLSGLQLHDPEEYDAASPVDINENVIADLEAIRALARLTEIDFDELTDNVNSVLELQDQASVGEVLEYFPATQGIASVIGLLSLAAMHGQIEEKLEHLHWCGTDSVPRNSTVVSHKFLGRLG